MAKEYVEREAAIALLHDSEIMGIPVWNAGLARGIEKLEGLPAADVVSGRDFRDCRNELCLQCGQYKTKHLGSCEGCRWDH